MLDVYGHRRSGSAARRCKDKRDRCTIIAADVKVHSDIVSLFPVLVSGRVAGDVECAAVEVITGASIAGFISAGKAFVDGQVAGSIQGDLVSLGPNARVTGNVVCRRLYAARGATVDGLTQPSMRLDRRSYSDLARIARDARAADRVRPARLDTLARDGLIFRRQGATFVSLYGHLELGRRWGRRIGLSPGVVRTLCAEDERPAGLAAARAGLADAPVPLSIIAQDVTLAGDIETRGDLRVQGEVGGDVRCNVLFVGNMGRIGGSIRATSACMMGVADGALTAERVLLQPTARVGGEVSFGEIEVRGGATYASGRQLETGTPDAPFRQVVAARHAAAAVASHLAIAA